MEFTLQNINEGMFYGELIPFDLENKEYYYGLILEIKLSLTNEIIIDFVNSSRLNMFIIESAQLLANSIRLFELGYFDAAYYSLRSSIEVFTILFDLYDYDDEKIVNNMDKFLKDEYFVRRKQTIDYLSKEGTLFKDVKEKMPKFLEEMEITSQKLNQRVHKSNFDNFYLIHKRKFKNEQYKEQYIKEFISLLEKSIKIVAVMRLIFDPIPLIMDDEELSHRIPDFMTYSFSSTLFEIIGEETLSEFKCTKKFIGFRDWVMGFQKRNEFVDAVVMYDFIDLDNLDEIFKQKDLLGSYDLLNVNIASCSNKITEIISSNGIIRYRTSAVNHDVVCNPLTYDEIKTLDKYFNLEFDKIHVSILNMNSNEFSLSQLDKLIYVFHNSEFTSEEIDKLKKVDVKI